MERDWCGPLRSGQSGNIAGKSSIIDLVQGVIGVNMGDNARVPAERLHKSVV